MRAAAESIVRHLGLSGMCGFDFMIENRSDPPLLIEINPRATQINHFPIGAGQDLSSALLAALEGRPAASPGPEAMPETDIALFPQEWQRDPGSPYLVSGFHDVPCDEPALLAYYGYSPPETEGGVRAETVGAERGEIVAADGARRTDLTRDLIDG